MKINRNLLKNEGYSNSSLLIKKSYGCYLEDVNGKTFIDTTLGSGTHILGHNSPIINDAIKQQLDNGILYTTANNIAYEVAELISLAYPSNQSVVFCNSGSEATMRAARIARAFTRRDKIAIFSGAWHGGNELFMYDHDYKSESLSAIHKSSGIPESFLENVIVLPYNDEKSFQIIEDNKDDIAMVIIEPSQGSNPRDDMFNFLKTLRSVTRRHGIVLCFDEMITGFRIKYGGCQEYYNVDADLTTYGKSVGGGLPIGVVAGRSEIVNIIHGSQKTIPVFMGGTFSANPLVMSVSKALLEHLLTEKKQIYSYLSKMGDYVKTNVNEHCFKNNIDAQVIGIGSMLRIVHTKNFIKSRRERDSLEIDHKIISDFYDSLLKRNIFVNSNKIIFLSMMHTEDIVNEITTSIIESIK
jgi:glutamate-1-semialdehyde 2,1-aminomutase